LREAASLSQQVRTTNTTGKIQELRQQVASGAYQPNAQEIARRMLLMGEAQE
jgi:anti-sigma28 factor (negative regulator of flagellin synthesis)